MPLIGLIVVIGLCFVSGARAESDGLGSGQDPAGGQNAVVSIQGGGGANTAPNYNYPRLALAAVLTPSSLLNSDAEIQKAAKFQYIHFGVGPASQDLPNRIAQLHQLNPGQTINGYWPTDFLWNNPGGLFAQALSKIQQPYPGQSTDWLVYDQQATPQPYHFFGDYTFDFTKQDFVDWYADFLATNVLGTGSYNGLFLDNFCDTISWTQATAGQNINYARDGYASLAAWDTAHAAGITSFITQLRQKIGIQFNLIGNCGRIDHDSELNGASLENFPFLNTGNTFTRWADNMLTPANGGGYLVMNRKKTSPIYNWILPYLTPNDTTDFYSAANMKLTRYGLTSALLGNGFYGPIQIQSGNPGEQSQDAWYDEYDNAGQGTGYLGQPTGNAYQMIDRTQLTGGELFANPGFESGTTSWTTNAGGLNSWSTDTQNVHQGTTSVKATVGQADPANDQSVYIQQQVNVSIGNIYATTFWVKADQTRTVHVQVILNNTTTIATEELPIDTTWQQYQVPFYATGSGSVKVYFLVGHEGGSVWLDDVSMKVGISSIWRRDFDHGSVFVNPCTSGYGGCVAQTFSLDSNMKRINGSQNPSLNNGATVSSVSLGAEDGIILLSLTNPPNGPVQCTELWTCTDWSACSAGPETRSCTDDNLCGTTTNKPAETQSCPADGTPPSAVTDLHPL